MAVAGGVGEAPVQLGAREEGLDREERRGKLGLGLGLGLSLWQVEWVEPQYNKVRVKRDLIEKRDEEVAYLGAATYDDENWGQQWYLVRARQCSCYNNNSNSKNN